MTDNLNTVVENALEEMKAKDVVVLDVTEMSDVMDHLVIASGTSNRHVKSVANNLVTDAKEAGFQPIGVEGIDGGEWVLVDFGEIVVHVMMPSTREFYDLEKLWSMTPATRR